MVKVRALRIFAGSLINRDELGLIERDQELEVSPNDAAFLERDGYAERLIEQSPEPVIASTEEKTGEPTDTPPTQQGETHRPGETSVLTEL